MPWWVGGTAYLRLPVEDYVAGSPMLAYGLDEARRLAACDDWGDDPSGG